MYAIVRKMTLLILACLVLLGVNGQQSSQQSLLWRISGKGLTKPSYLFGTIHVKNKKAFYFKDSLYHFLENTDGFAMELHPDSAGQIITAFAEGRVNSSGWDDKTFDDKEVEKVWQKIKTPATPVKKTLKEKLSDLMEKILDNKTENENGMETFVDAYLYGLAQQKGKKIFGLEEVEDQIVAFDFLMKGMRMSKMADLFNKWDIHTTAPIYRYYYKEQIDSIYNFYSTYFSDTTLRGFLYDRNVRMANQMDSIMKRHSLFTAVGAAHLPGKEGVISLLHKMGYTVEPVYSSKKIFAGDYRTKPFESNWIRDTSVNFGFTYQVPGKVTKQMGANGNEVAYHFDLTSSTMFMTVGGRLSPKEQKKPIDSVFDAHIETMTEPSNGTVLSRKPVTVKGLKGFEVIAYGSGAYSKITELFDDKKFYVLMVAHEVKDRLNNAKTAQFLNSFERIPLTKSSWKKFNSVQEGFSVEFPGEPRFEPHKKSDGNSVLMNGHVSMDAIAGINYSVYFSRAHAGNTLMRGESFFNVYQQSIMENSEDEEIEMTDTIIHNCPARRYMAASPEGRCMEVLVVSRGNTSYFMAAEFDETEKENTDIRRFFHSFVLQPFPDTKWSTSTNKEGEFTGWFPGEVNKVGKDSTNSYLFGDGDESYYAQNLYSSGKYSVDVKTINAYYWAPNADSVYSYWRNKIISEWSDSIIVAQDIVNGDVRGKEIIAINKYEKVRTRHRMLLNGRKMYVLSYDMDDPLEDSGNMDQFFHSFRLTNEKKDNDIYTAGPEKLFSDLLSKDSGTWHRAFNAFDIVRFGPEHIQLLAQKAMLDYPLDTTEYQTANSKIFDEMTELIAKNKESHAWVRDFVKNSYPSSTEAAEKYRYSLLSLLAVQKNAEAYKLIGELFTLKVPNGSYSYRLFYKLRDSLELTKLLYPGLLRYAGDSSCGLDIVTLTKHMLDSNQLDLATVKLAKKELLALARYKLPATLAMAADDWDYDYDLQELMELLGMLKDKEADDMVAKYLPVKIISLKLAAAASLLKNGRTVSTAELKKIALNEEYRSKLYEELEKQKKTTLFPSEFANQQSMAKSYIYRAMMDEDEMGSDAKLFFIKKIVKDYKGVKKIFYLFRVNINGEEEYAGEEEPDSYLAVAGPFDMEVKKISLSEKDNISGLYYAKPFDGMKLDELFEKYLAYYLKAEQ